MSNSSDSSLTTAELAGRRDEESGSELTDTPTTIERAGMSDGDTAASMPDGASSQTALVPAEEAQLFQARWDESQRSFIDEPRASVEQADQLVAELMQSLANGFASEREALEQQWSRGEEVSTEDLRQALQRYRSFFHRLLAV